MEEDRLAISIEEERFIEVAKTPRQVVQQQAGLYDPLGMISPFILIGRRWTQKAMTGSWGWDKPLEKEVLEGFQEWTSSIPKLKELSIPRPWHTPETVGEAAQLHVFADASQEGYGAVAYIRIVGKDGRVRICFVGGKSHVVPLDSSRTSHHNSTPRLELVGALKAVELMKAILKSVPEGMELEPVLWTDSMCFWKQIHNPAGMYKAFVANRLSKIHKDTNPEQWRFVDGEKNPADLCSRGIKANEKAKWEIYLNGPDFLRQDEKSWEGMMKAKPIAKASIAAVSAEEGKGTLTEQEGRELWVWEVVSRVSDWQSKIWLMVRLRKMAATLRVKATWRAGRSRTKELERIGKLRWSLFFECEKEVMRAIQAKHFLEERREVAKKGVISPDQEGELSKRSSPLTAHNPFLDKDGLLKVGSRLVHAQIKEEQRFPVLLPKDDENVKSLIRHLHRQERHAGPKHVLCQLRRKVWILKGLQATKKVINACVHCQKMNKKPCEQKMAPLPAERVSTTAPFYHTGVDLMGPFRTKMNGRALHKVWVAVFTCFETRSVHAECVFKLDADSMINAIIRFNARRPGLARMYSDRGTNFTAANSILSKELKEINGAAEASLAKKGIIWEFNPPNAPHRGGVWERVVGMFKKHLGKVASGDALQYDVFNTFIAEVEGILNRRPLTQISTDSKDVEALTPNHILAPASVELTQERLVDVIDDKGENVRASWRKAVARINGFWKAFKSDYLQLLHQRQKWKDSRMNLKKGDLVIIVDETTSRDAWRLGRIENVHESGQHVRKVDIKRGDGRLITRDRTKVVRLEMDE